MSAKSFFMLAIEIIRSGDAQHTLRRSTSAPNNLLEMRDIFEASLATHATVFILLQYAPIYLWNKSTIVSNTIKYNNKPAHLRSKFLMMPVELSSETIYSCISFDHSMRHTMGSSESVPEYYSPSALNLHASQCPR